MLVAFKTQDPNGNGHAGDAGENDPTSFVVGQTPVIGAAHYVVILDTSTPIVRMYWVLENLGEANLGNPTLDANLNSVFGAGNFSILGDPEIVANGEFLQRNSAFNGNTNTALLLSGGTLQPGERVVIRQDVRVNFLVDQGLGLGIYESQDTVQALGLDSTLVSDDTDNGLETDPNGNGSPSDAGEDDPTLFSLVSRLGLAVDLTMGTGEEVMLDFYLEAFGPYTIENISLPASLDALFGASAYTTPSVTLIDDPSTLSLNGFYDGTSSEDLFVPGSSSLATGDTAQIRVTTTLTALEDLGFGVGDFEASFSVTGTQASGGTLISDVSTSGTDPDPNGDTNPAERTVTPYTVIPDAFVGGALTATVAANDVTLDLYLENLGSEIAMSVETELNLDTVFGAGNYTLLSPPAFVTDPGTLVLNGGFDGSGDSQILQPGGTLAGGGTAQIQLVRVDVLDDILGEGPGLYEGQFLTRATGADGFTLEDLSDSGNDPDPGSDGDPTSLSENDPTPIQIGEAELGIAMKILVSGTSITYIYTVENLGDLPVSNLFMENPLNPVYGSGNYSIQEQPRLLEGPGTLLLSPQYFGFSIFSRIINGGSLGPGERVRFSVKVNVTNVTDLGNGFGVYQNSVTISATDYLGTPLSDTSDDGYFADPDGDGNPDEAGENDTSVVIIGDEANLGVSQTASPSGNQVTLSFYLENFGNSQLNTLSLTQNLDEVFGAGNYSISSAPGFVDDPGTITLNAGYDGSADDELIQAGSTLSALDTAQINVTVQVTTQTDRGIGYGVYESQAVATGSAPLGSSTYDLSDSGTDPDPDGDGLPFEEGENDPLQFSLLVSEIGTALEAEVDGLYVTFTYRIKNLGGVELSGLSLPHDLDSLFGAGNYRVVSGPLFPDLFRDLELNPAFDGSGDPELISGGTLGPGVEETFQVLVRVEPLINSGAGLGVYQTQLTGSGTGSFGARSDLTDNGSVVDSNGNDLADDAGEDDPTGFTLSESPVLGAALTASVTGNTVTLDLVLENLGDATLGGFSVPLDLDAVLGAGNYTLTTAPAWTDDPGTLNLNGAFDGASQTQLIGTGTLTPGDTAALRLVVTVDTPSDQGSGIAVYEAQVTAEATSLTGTLVSDLSDDGTDPDPDGNGNPADSGEGDPTEFRLRSDVGGLVWNDLDGDGMRDAGEPGMSGVTVFLDTNNNGAQDAGETSDTTDGTGAYLFSELEAGTYRVRVDESTVTSGFVRTGGTNPSIVNLAGADVTDRNFGYQQQDASIGDFVWNDLDGDGVQDAGEPGLSGVTVFFDLNSNGSLDGGEPTQVTDANGVYDFTDLPTGTYILELDASTLPNGLQLSTANLPDTVNLAAGEDFNGADFGYRPIPYAAFSGDVLSGCAPLTVQFTDASLNATEWNWDFGDGGTSTDQNPEYTYDTPGVYTVILVVSDGVEDDTAVQTNYIDVNGPVPDFTASPVPGNTTPHTVTFTDTTDYTHTNGSTISWLWDFGDGNTSTLQSPLHNYTIEGVFTVSLTVTDTSSTCSRQITKTNLIRVATLPGFSMAFSPDAQTGAGIPTTLTFTVDNTSSALSLTGINFTLNLPAGLQVASPAGITNTLTGGTVTAVAGSGTIQVTGSSLAAGTSGTVSVDVLPTTLGSFVATTGDLTSVNGNSGTATDTLTVNEAPSLVVTTTDDDVDPFDGETTLREAITYAMTLGGTPEITFSNVTTDGAVDFYDGNPKTITLAGAALPTIDNPVSILGPGADVLAISGNNTSQIFIFDANDIIVSDLTLTNGRAVGFPSGQGGAIRQLSGGSMLSRCQITNNVADAFGGAILSDVGSMIISDCTLSGNTANGTGSGGGAIVSVGTLTLINSTLSGNSAPNANSSGGGGGAINNFGSLTLIQTTITGNRASAAASGGGIDVNGGPVVLINSIVAGNFKGVGTTPSDIEGGTINTASNNLIGDATTSGGISDGANGNIVGNTGTGTLTIATVLDTNLSDNGGPTLTHAILPGSPALNAGDTAQALDADSNPLTFDQRGTGFSRVVGPAVDIGAFELPNSPPTLVGTAPNDGVPDQTAIEDGAPILLDLSAYFADAEQASDSLDFSVQTNSNAGLVTPSITGKDLTLTLIADQSGTADITIRATDNGAQFTDSTFTLTVNKQVDLVVTADESLDPVLAGNSLPGNLIHQVKVLNNGPSDATAVEIEITQTLPTGVTIDSVTPDSGSETGGTWTIPSLTEGTMATLTLTLSVPDTVSGGTDTLITTGTLNSVTEPLISTGDDTDTVSTSVSSPASSPVTLETSIIGNFGNSLLEQTVKVTNNNPTPIVAFRMLVSGLPADVTLVNAHGETTGGDPFVVWNQPVPAGDTAEVLIQYARNSGNPNFTPVYTVEFLTAVEATTLLDPPALGDTLTIDRFVQLPDGGMLLEWASTPGQIYYIQYTSDMITYTTVLPGITAGANRTQWIDRGPPQTESHPKDLTGMRAYRVKEGN